MSLIEGQAFSGCPNLTAITVDPLNQEYSSLDGVLFDKSQSTLLQCPGGKMGSYSVPDRATRIAGFAFDHCAGLTSVAIPNSVTHLGEWAFSYCLGLTGEMIINSVATIGTGTFLGCSGLTGVRMGNSLTNIGNQAFKLCTRLMNVTIPPGVDSIGVEAFMGCSGLTSMTIPDGVTGVGAGAFMGCAGMTNLTLGNHLTHIGERAFWGCRDLMTLRIPSSVTGIGTDAFAQCTGLTAITVDASNPAYASQDGVLFNGDRTTLILCPIGKTGEYRIPCSVTNISDSAFNGCAGLTQVVIPDGVANIGNYAFSGCTSLPRAIIPESVATIGEYAFYGCAGLTRVNIPDRVARIEWFTFSGCIALTNVTIGDSVTYVGLKAFEGCAHLRSATIPNTVTVLETQSFVGCTDLTTMRMGNGVTYIGGWAFGNCANLLGVYFEGNPPTVQMGGSIFTPSDSLTVFYRAGATGWGPAFEGAPTALWTPTPTYAEWVKSSGLVERYPNASAEQDDADGDGMNNLAEMRAGTDPTRRESVLAFERAPRPADLTEADRGSISATQRALYFQSVSGKAYQVQRANPLGDAWTTLKTLTASTTQKRVVVDTPALTGFYRILVVPLP